MFVHGGAVAGTGDKGGPFLVHAGNLEKHINYIVSERNAQARGWTETKDRFLGNKNERKHKTKQDETHN